MEEVSFYFSVIWYHEPSSEITVVASRSRWTSSIECVECQKYFDLGKENNYLFRNNFSMA